MTTAVTLLHTLLHGRLVGRDSLDNRYFESKKTSQKSRRWVVYGKKPEDASLIPAAWHAWIHHTTDIPPNKSPTPRLQHAWQKPHRPNSTGTPPSSPPPAKKQHPPKPYEAWTPPSSDLPTQP